MATLYREFIIDTPPEKAWDALRDFGGLSRLAPGFITACTLEGDVRSISFANGASLKEQLVGLDDGQKRLCYTVLNGRASHHHASAQVFAHEGGKTRFVWITDVLPDAMAVHIGPMMDAGQAAMQKALACMP